MVHKVGAYLGGVRTVECLRQRSVIDDVTGCWHWRLATEGNVPKVSLILPDGSRTSMRGRRAALFLAGAKLRPAVFAIPRCKSADCVNPDHVWPGTRAQHGKWLSSDGRLRNQPSRAAANQRAKRARKNLKLSIEKAREIRASTETQSELARRFGVSQAVIWSVVHGRLWREPGVSIFNGPT